MHVFSISLTHTHVLVWYQHAHTFARAAGAHVRPSNASSHSFLLFFPDSSQACVVLVRIESREYMSACLSRKFLRLFDFLRL